MKHLISFKRQKGMATLLVSVIILLLITMVVIYSANTAIMEQKVSANAYRANQAHSYADGGIDYSARYLRVEGYPDIDGSGCLIDSAGSFIDFDENASGSCVNFDTGLASNYQTDMTDNNPTIATQLLSSGLVSITATDQSIDGTANRTITQVVSGAPLGGSGSNQPMITRGGVGLTGNMRVMNRYANINVWSGDTVAIGNSQSAESYILTPGTDTSGYTQANYVNPAQNTGDITRVSGNKEGNGIDIIDQDVTLSGLTPDEFFVNFINEPKAIVKQMAVDNGQYFADFSSSDTANNADPLKGLVWIGNGSAISTNGGTYGSLDAPVLIIVDASSLTTTGNIQFYGLLYIIGDWDTQGTVNITGSIIIEGDVLNGTGTTSVVYSPDAASPTGGWEGTAARVPGTWKDF
ncbi:MAG: hypothetical protein KZQ83_09340 [gamma proteobacterium symbiont of Taylorina sp.]|nr:hypothetical protein [gamma proteobacterium symbiont of Taylorina sp.]